MGGHTLETLSALAGRLAGMSPDDPARAPLRAEIDAEFWRVAQQLAHDACLEPLPRRLALEADTLLLLDFGVLPGVVSAGSPDFAAARRAVAASPNSMSLFSDALGQIWQDTMRDDLLQQINVQLEAISRDLAEWPELHLTMIRHRDQLVLAALGDSPQAQHALRLYSEMDERLEQFKRYEKLSEQAAFRSNDERKHWLSIKGYVTERQQQLEPLLSTLLARARDVHTAMQEIEAEIAMRQADLRTAESDSRRIQEQILSAFNAGAQGAELQELQRELARVVFVIEKSQSRIVEAQARAEGLRGQNASALAAEQLVSAAETVFDSVGRLLELHGNRAALQEKLFEEQTAQAQVSASGMRGTLHAEIANLRGHLRLAARYGHAAECALDVGDGVRVEPSQLDAALAHIQAFDPHLFRNVHARRHGRPAMLLAPGIGEGVYDRERHRFVVPQRSVRGAEASLASACALYRLELDATEGNALAAAFRKQQRRTAKVRSNLKVRNQLAEEYQLWITQEAHGNLVLSREARQWFESNIAPPKDAPWTPPEFLDLAPRQLTSRLNEAERAPQSADREFRCGVLYWLLNPDDSRAIRDWALPRIERAMELDAAQHGYVYSAATLHMKIKSFQRAIDLFHRFSRQAPQSWWSRKAIELCAVCR